MVLYFTRSRNAISWCRLGQENWRPQSRLAIRCFGVDHSKEAVHHKKRGNDLDLDRWDLTVGLEIHAQLNADRKLFSKAATSINAEPNTHVSVFDLALPGSLPIFQKAALLPALRAAIALECEVMHKSWFDRKHYFYPDQPAGYQITQFYQPFAKGGSVTLYDHDGIAPDDGKRKTVGIQQIQLEQDTAKTIQQFPSTNLLDFNRVSHPLIEIITLPQIHHPQTAAACVKKIQAILHSVSAVTTGMEMGGMRADVNVSVQSKAINGRGQRTEIKNLSSIKAVEDAIIAEGKRQIEILEAGGTIEGETRGWTLGSTETTKLRDKEGEVDYRYMPDADLAPLIIDPKLIDHISRTLPMLPDDSIANLVNDLELTLKDAKTLVALDNGARLDYFDSILDELAVLRYREISSEQEWQEWGLQDRKYAKTVANWVLHELGGLLSASEQPFSQNKVSPAAMAAILRNLSDGRITGRTAKQLLRRAFDGESRDINAIIQDEHLALHPLSHQEYETLARALIAENSQVARQITDKGQLSKLHWFVGQMMRRGDGNMEASVAEAVLKDLLGLGP